MKDNLTKDEVVELIKSSINIEGWRGVKCMGCTPKQDAPYPATANVLIGLETWQCPRCNFVNLLTYTKISPIYRYPEYGALGSVIIEAYSELELDLNFDLDILDKV